MNRYWFIAFVFASAFGVEAVGVWAGDVIATWAILAAHVIALFGALQVGRLIMPSRVGMAVLFGLLLGALFWFASWRFIGLLMVDVFQRDNERGFIQFSGPYSLYLPPTALVAAVLAGVGAWLHRNAKKG